MQLFIFQMLNKVYYSKEKYQNDWILTKSWICCLDMGILWRSIVIPEEYDHSFLIFDGKPWALSVSSNLKIVVFFFEYSTFNSKIFLRCSRHRVRVKFLWPLRDRHSPRTYQKELGILLLWFLNLKVKYDALPYSWKTEERHPSLGGNQGEWLEFA